MKKVLSLLLAGTMTFGAAAITASAEKAAIFYPQQCDINTTDENPYITQVRDENGVITGRTIDATEITAATELARTDVSTPTFNYRVNVPKGDGTYAFGGSTQRLKNNFSWEFDFCVDELPTTTGTDGAFVIQIGNAWQNAIMLWSKDGMLTNGEAEKKCYLRWGGGSGTSYRISGGDEYYTASVPILRQGCTYHLKIEVDVRNQKIYTTFTNPYVTNVDNKWTLNDEPAAEGENVWTFESVGPANFTSCTCNLADITNASTKLNVTLKAKGPVKITLSNEKFYIDKICTTAPELMAAGKTVAATIHSVGITNFNFSKVKTPLVVCAVYDADGKLAAHNMTQTTVETMTALEDNSDDALVDCSSLADGTYTVKAFVWGGLSGINDMNPIYSHAEKVLTIADGELTLSDPVTETPAE